MTVYVDASALVKRYVAESGSAETGTLLAEAAAVATAVISRAEVSAALARARRSRLLTAGEARAALQTFRSEWPDLVRLTVSEPLVSRADALAWEHGLRGYDAVQLAAALLWQEMVGEPVVLATFDDQLWDAGRASAMDVWPDDLDRFRLA